MFRLIYLVCFLLIGCGGEIHELESESSFIVNGSIDYGHPAVGLLYISKAKGNFMCTATLVGSKTVLTAAHCVEGAYSLSFEINDSDVLYYVDKVHIHPEYYSWKYGDDIAIVVLRQVVHHIKPAIVSKKAPQIGQEITIVGYGITASEKDDLGIKRKTKNTITWVYDQYFSFKGSTGSVGNICNGDSGGPSFRLENSQEVLIGIHSTGSVVCGYRGNDMRADYFYDWIFDMADGDLFVPDIGVPDASVPDIGVPDAGVPDVGVPDVGVPDTENSSGCSVGSFSTTNTSWLFVLFLLLIWRRYKKPKRSKIT